jgi:fatty-acyl-CoA synthase
MVLQGRFDPERTLAAIDRHRPSTLAVVPVMLQRMLDLPAEVRDRYDTSSLRVVIASGSALSADLARRFMDAYGEVLYNLYGSTEIAWATIATPADLRAAPGTVGRAPLGTRLEILGDDDRPLPTGQTGRIFVGHEMLFEGYTSGESEETVEGMMSAGDLGHIDAEGRLFVDARADDMIVSGGENVYPGEVEELLDAHERIAEAAVVGVDDEEFGQRLKAWVVARDTGLTADEVRAHVKDNLARYKVPRDVEFIDELPRNAAGKIAKRELGSSGEGGGG